MTMTEFLHKDIETDPDVRPAAPMELNVCVKDQTAMEVLMNEDPNMLVPPKELVDVEAVEGDVAALDQEAAQVLGTISITRYQLADDIRTGNFIWKIEKFSDINLSIRSNTFVSGRYKWHATLSVWRQDHLSISLDVADSAELPLDWSIFAYFSFAVVNQFDQKRTVKRRLVQHFNHMQTHFGFPLFMPLQAIHNLDKGFLVDDSLIIHTEVDVRKFADHYLPYDSKKATGYVGLKNQGATCYLNSILQTLYHLPYFRKAVYHIPTSENSSPSKSIAFALQSLFYKIQYGDTSPETEDLTQSLGWDTAQCFMEGDVHELNLVLCEQLDEKMKGTPLDGTLQQLFEGHVINYVECIDVSYTSTYTESFCDLQLDVKGCKDVYESLDKYIYVEKLEGENQYHAEQFGLQDARKGVKFIDFPPVLQLHLKRFDYDPKECQMMKINDRYEFPFQLDLDTENGKYLSPSTDRSVQNLYTLHSVVVHTGADLDTGHYYAYIRPTLSDKWYKFNDHIVTKEELQSVLDKHCGGEAEVQQENLEFNDTPSKSTMHSNAYMLVYVRECDKDKVMCTAHQEVIPNHLQVWFKENEEAEKKRILNSRTELYIDIQLALDDDLVRQINMPFDLVDGKKVLQFRMKKLQTMTMTIKQLKHSLANKVLYIPPICLRFWLWSKWEKGAYGLERSLKEEKELLTRGLERPLTDEEEWSTIFELKQELKTLIHDKELNLFVEVLPLEHTNSRSKRSRRF